jgi:hypothetical protein
MGIIENENIAIAINISSRVMPRPRARMFLLNMPHIEYDSVLSRVLIFKFIIRIFSPLVYLFAKRGEF